jgi:N-acetylneuraminic acid mutarotase
VNSAWGAGLYLIGGRGANGPVADVYRIDREAAADWVRRAPLPAPRSHVHGGLVGGRVYVPGGCGRDGLAGSDVAVYTPADDHWSAGPELPAPRCDYALAVHEGRLFLLGGRESERADTATASVLRLDPGAAAWTVLPDMPAPRAGLAAIVMTDGIHLLGGRDRTGAPTRDHWLFDPLAADGWSTDGGPQLPEPRAGHGAVDTQGRLMVIGGGATAPLDAVVWDPDAGLEWRYDPRLLPSPEGVASPQRGSGVVVDAERTIVVTGGEAADGRLLDLHLWFRLSQPVYIPGGA